MLQLHVLTFGTRHQDLANICLCLIDSANFNSSHIKRLRLPTETC